MDVLAGLKPGVLLSGEDAERVGAEVVALTLEEVGGDRLGAVAVEEGEGRRVGRDRDTPNGRLGDDAAPSGLSLLNGLLEALKEKAG